MRVNSMVLRWNSGCPYDSRFSVRIDRYGRKERSTCVFVCVYVCVSTHSGDGHSDNPITIYTLRS